MAWQKTFKEFVESKYRGWFHIYTDGSKSEIGVGAKLPLETAQNLHQYQILALFSQQKHMHYTKL